MAARIYSTAFVMQVDTPINGHYEVPVGFLAVVRDMRFYLPNTGDWTAGPVCQVAVDDAAQVIWEIRDRNPAVGVYTWEGRQVFSTVLSWVHYDTEAKLTASGYLLTLPV